MHPQLPSTTISTSPGRCGDFGALFARSAETLGQQILHACKLSPKHGLLWRAPSNVSGEPEPLGPHLYDGCCGVALFLAALSRRTRDSPYAAFAREALAPLRRQLRFLVDHPERAERLEFRLGLTSGLGGYVYTFLLLADWLSDESFLESADRAASLITPERIAADHSLDVTQGSAGALLSLLALASLRPNQDKLARAVNCGEHLLATRSAPPDDPSAAGWRANGYPPWCGFAHGAAGIAEALARLSARTGREDFLAAAVSAATFERRHFDAQAGNWRDLRGLGDHFMTAWCHGAPGILLNRFTLWRACPTPELENDLLAALATTRDTPRLNRDTLCCGNLGRADILLHSALILDDATLHEAANHLAETAIQRAEVRGQYLYTLDGSDSPAGLFTGMSGIGYALLRLSDPTLPSILAVAT
jgi:type 2 lantibiotic biosynthesis protein LanM